MPNKTYSILFLFLLITAGIVITACNSNEQFAGAATESNTVAKPSESEIITDSTLQTDTVVAWNSFKEGALLKLKTTEKRIEDAQSAISIGIGPVHDQQFKIITDIEYKKDGLKKSLSDFRIMNMEYTKSFMRSFNTGILQVNQSLDTLTIE